MSIIQRSAAKDFSKIPVPIIYAADNIEPADFSKSLTGSMLFVENGFDKWVHRATELDALGIITVSMPEIRPVRVNMSEDTKLADSHANLSFHLYSEEQENKLCGFAISPRSGKRLREACIATSSEGSMPMACFKIDSTLEKGSIENVEAVIRGDIDEEILMVAHLCHPRSSVNDNASGAAAAMEAMCALQRLIKEDALPHPYRTIRLLLMPEFTGTYAFLKENENRLSKLMAGINLDMVAGYQSNDAGALIIVDTPDSSHSFSGDLSSIILEELSKECAFGGKDRYVPLFLGVKVPFAFGSDHYILSDPTVDIPAVALTQWPDKTYHTSADSLEHIDPMMLRRAAALAGAYCYIYARFSLTDAQEVVSEVSSRFFRKITGCRTSEDRDDAKKRGEYIRDLYFATLDRIASLFEEKELYEIIHMIEREKEFFLRLENLCCGECEKGDLSSAPIPMRLFTAPLAMKSITGDMTVDEKEKLHGLRNKYPELASLDDYIMYEADGKRTVEEIASRVCFQTGVDCGKYVQEIFEFLSEVGLAKFL